MESANVKGAATYDFLNRLASDGILVSAQNGKLLCKSEDAERLNGYLAEIKIRKQDILEYLDRANRERGWDEAIEPAPRGVDIPLSFSQQLIYVTAMLDRQNAAYNVPVALELRGELDVPALRRTVNALIERHQILRTVYVEKNGRPVQQVLPMRDWPLPVEALSQEMLESRLQKEALRPFDLERDLVFRARVFQLAPRHHVFALTMHHIASDQWSAPILVEEFKQLYLAFSQQREAQMPALPIQYADYAYWERRPEIEARLEKQLGYWKEQLKGLPQVHSLPLDKPRPKRQSFQGETFRQTLEPRIGERLQRLALLHSVTPFTLFHAALNALLARWSGESDIVIGTMVAKRSRAETAPLIGFFVNNLVLRTPVTAEDSYKDLIERSHRVCLDAFSHQDVPFERLVAELAGERSQGHSALFQIAVLMDDMENADFNLRDLQIEPVRAQDIDTKFDLTVNLRNDRGTYSILWEYNTDVFVRPTLESLADSFAVLLEKLVSQPDVPHARHSLTTAAVDLPVFDRAATASVYIHQALEQRALTSPDELALVYEYSDITYGELNERANQLAHYLAERQIAPGQRVGLFFERSLDLLVAILAVMKSGAAYVPIDPDYPAQRIRLIIEDTAPGLLLSQLAVRKRLETPDIEVCCLDDQAFADTLDSFSKENLDAAAIGLTPEHLAYIIYTSGSTGKPKGVTIRHRSLIHLRENMQRLVPRSKSWRNVAWNAPYVFDASLQPIIQIGAPCTLHLLAKDLRLSPQALAEYLREKEIDELDITPSLLQDLLPELEKVEWFPSILVGGEAVSQSLWQALRVRYARREEKVLNVYGPTECTVNSTAADVLAHEQPTIGTPLEGVAAVVLDEQLNAVPREMKGELYLTGAGLSPGYWNAPELTAKAFVDLPVNGAGPVRFYKTGDVVRLRTSGALDYLGRADTQVKLRGFRIELDEIAHVMRQHPRVKDAVVMVRQGADDLQRLVGYAVAKGRNDSDLKEEIRAALGEALPEYMVPNDVVLLKSIPLTPNGKVDYKALPEPDRSALSTVREYVAPGNAIEAQMQALWQELLKVESVSVEDNFFLLGGHSLMATRLNNRVQQYFGVSIVLSQFFVTPTIRRYASLIAEALERRSEANPPRAALPASEPAPLSYAQQRLLFMHQTGTQQAAYNISLPIQLDGELRLDVLRQAYTEVARRHEILRSQFVQTGEEWLQQVCDGVHVSIDVVALESEEQISEEAGRPFDLLHGPPVRLKVYRVTEQRCVLQITVHHTAADGWSLQIFLREFAAIYNALVASQPVELPPLPLQLRDYALWERHELQGERLQALCVFWRNTLSDLPAVHKLPLDFNRPKVQSTRAQSVRLTLDEQTSAAIVELGRRHQTTLFVTMSAALTALLARWTGERDIVIGTTCANRDRAEFAGLIGPLLNSVVLRQVLSGDPGFTGILSATRETCQQAFAHSALPFDLLVKELQAATEAGIPPLFQICLSVDEEDPAPLALTGLRATLMEAVSLQVKYDLHVSVSRAQGRVEVDFFYCEQMFAQPTMQSLLNGFEHLLRNIAADPQTPLSALAIQSAEETESGAMLKAGSWRSMGELAHRRLEQQADLSGAAPAVCCQDAVLSFAELNARCNRLARLLVQRGVRPHGHVLLSLDRSIDMVVAMFAVMKTGAAFVPVDPRAPLSYVRPIFRTFPDSVLISQEAFRAKLDELDHPTVFVDDAGTLNALEALSGENLSDPLPEVTSKSLAYVMHTSGSTGRPKAVGITHDNLVNYRDGLIDLLRLDRPGWRWAWNSPYFFDSATKVFAAIGLPGCVHVLTDDVRLSPGELARYLIGHDVDFLDITPSHLTEVLPLLVEAPAGSVPNLILGGEWISEKLWRSLQELFRGSARSAFNMYGPTECTGATLAANFKCSAAPTLGQPLTGRGCVLLDETLRPVARGMLGEVCIFAAGVGVGYLHDPEMTAQRFVEIEWPGQPRQRIYRTGDLARANGDGRLTFLGRRDHQVKIHGHRIELGAIESTLLRRPDVANAAVLAKADRSGDEMLAAYVLAADDRTLDTAALREYLEDELPAYMVPASIVVVPSWPLTPSGKVDRRALLQIEPGIDAPAKAARGEPENATESQLLTLWRELLGREEIAIDDNFFAVGGHSLALMRLIVRIRNQLGVEVALPDLIKAATLRNAARLIEQQRSGATLPQIRPVSRSLNLPLSFAQQRLWLQAQVGATGSAYHVIHVLDVEGAFSLEAFEHSVRAIVQRHESLRTVIYEIDGTPFQRIQPESTAWVAVFDLQRRAGPENQKETDRLIELETTRPFDLTRDCMLRAAVMLHPENRFTVTLTLHHIASDGWSMQILVSEIGELYNAFLNNTVSSLQPLVLQYADYAYWQRKQLEGERYRRLLSYWKEQLEDLPAVHSLPLDAPRPAIQTFNGDVWEHSLDADLTSALKALAVREGLSLFVLLEAAFAVLLARWSRESDLAIGTAVANREMKHCEHLIGFFVNVLVLRHRFDLKQRFLDVLQQCKALCLGAFEHVNMPFDRLVDELNVPRSLSHSPLFQIMFSLQPEQSAPLELQGVKWKARDAGRHTAKFDLMLTMVEADGELGAGWEYNRDLFAAATIESLSQSFITLLRFIVRDAQQTLDRLDILPVEQQQQIARWSNSTACRPVEGNLAALFAEQVRRAPEQCALIAGERRYSYAELDRRANQLANHLLTQSARDGARIGISLEQSAEAIIAMLAVIKAGCVYVPIDPEYPAARKQALIAAADVSFVIGADLHAHVWMQCPDRAPLAEWSSDRSAYIIFTSGTTGKPKGAEISHAGVIRLVRDTNYINLTSDHTIAQCAPQTFDAATFEIWGALLNGATISLVDKFTLLNAPAFAAKIRSDGITTLFLTTALFNQLVEVDPGMFGSLTHLLTGGEAIHPEKVHAVLRAGKPEHLLHVYGPTECTTFSLFYEMHTQERGYPIGRPVANTAAIVLNDSLTRAAIGQTGELYLGGPGVAKGYVGEPALTAERFIPNPFAVDWPECPVLYRTGDLARLRADGEIEYAGRTDSQVKINGFRIELDEVEHALKVCAGVAGAVVVVHREASGERALLGYWEPAEDTSGAIRHERELRMELAGKLPDYMLPKRMIKVSALPLNANGKIDKAKLPRPADDAASEVVSSNITETENVLRALWQQLLHLPQPPSLDVSFFALGGSSILVIKLHALIQQQLGVDLPALELFQSPSIRAIAERIDARREGPAKQRLIKAPPMPSYPVSYAQEQLWVEYNLGFGSSYNVPIAFRAPAHFDLAKLRQGLTSLIRRHEVLRTAYVFENGELRQRVLEQPPECFVQIPAPSIDFAEADMQRRLANALDVGAGEVLKCFCYDLPDGSHYIVINLSHIATDGWSMQLLLDELANDTATEPRWQYKDFAHTQRQRGAFTEQLDYWVAHLQPLKQLPPLRTDAERGVAASRKAMLEWALDAKQSAFVAATAREQGCTDFVVLLALYSTVIALHNDAERVSIGTDYAGREHAETQTMQGFFVEQLCLLSHLRPEDSLPGLLQRTKSTVWAAYAHSSVPLSQIVSALGFAERTQRRPLFQAKLVYQNFEPTNVNERFAALGVEPVELRTADAKAELMLTLAPDGDLIRGAWEYDAALLKPTTVAHLGTTFKRLIDLWSGDPNATFAQVRQQLSVLAKDRLSGMRFTDWKKNARGASEVQGGLLPGGSHLPWVYHSSHPGGDLVAWYESHRSEVETRLLEHGAVLFRGFDLHTAADFAGAARSLIPARSSYIEGATPRQALGNNIYTSTEFPQDQEIFLHSELSYVAQPPQRLLFFCETAPGEGGRTPLADTRRIYQRVPADILAEFEARGGWMLVRHYSDALGLNLRDAYKGMTLEQIREYCKQCEVQFEQLDERQATTRQVRPVSISHPVTAQPSWFNHAVFWHPSSLSPEVRAGLRMQLGNACLPFNTCYGDGTPISDETIQLLRDAYLAEQVSFPWRPGDLLLIDNFSVAHGREAFSGPRKILVSMGGGT